MVTVNQLRKEKEKLEAAAAAIDEQIAQVALEGFKPKLEEVVSMVGEIDTFDKSVKAHIKTLVSTVFGSEFAVKRKNGKSTSSSVKRSWDFDWEALVETLNKNGVTSKSEAKSKSDIAVLFFGDDKSDFKASTWNNTIERERHITKEGNVRGATYWVKGN